MKKVLKTLGIVLLAVAVLIAVWVAERRSGRRMKEGGHGR